jgi:hypothetical protein
MNRADRLEEILHVHGGKATLDTILKAIREDGGLVYKFTAACSELRARLRKHGKDLVCHQMGRPSLNIYEVVDLPKDGQLGLGF